jgi:HK97 gp10 family phage protein
MSIDGLENLQRKLDALAQKPATRLGKAMLAGGFVLEGAIKISLQAVKHGRRYGKHVASAPGEPPATDIGALANSIRTELVTETPGYVEAQVATNMVYAPILEEGGSYIKARPFFRPALDANAEKIAAAARETLKRAIDEATG